MDKDRIAGSAKDFAGKVESTIGDMAGDAKTQAEGRAREAAGTVQNLYGQAKDAASDAADAAVNYAKDAYENSGDTVAARTNYELLASWNPYLEDGVIAAADYFRKHDRNKLKAYAILAEAIQINNSSIPLYQAYIREATRLGFDDYAAGATDRLVELQNRLR